MGIELAKAYIKIRGDSSKLKPDLSRSRKETEKSIGKIEEKATEAVANIQSATLSMDTVIKGAAVGMLASFAAITKGFFQSGLRAAGQFEQTTIAFETMLGSAAETKKILEDLTVFAAKTPFEMPEILQAARGLIQFGERGDELMESLNLLGNAASGTSTPFGFLALVFNQVRGVGKLLTQDFRQLSTRGVLSLQDIAKHFDVTTNAAQKMLSTGKISFKDLKDILRAASAEGGKFNNLMERQSTSLLGLLSTLSDAWNIMKRVMATAVVPVAKKVVAVLVAIVDQMQSFVIWSDGFASAALAGASALAILVGFAVAAKMALVALGVTWSAVMIGTGWGVIILALGAAIGVLVMGISKLVSKANEMKMMSASFAALSLAIEDARRNLSGFFDFLPTLNDFSNAFFVFSVLVGAVLSHITSFFADIARGFAMLTSSWDNFFKISFSVAKIFLQSLVILWSKAWFGLIASMVAATAAGMMSIITLMSGGVFSAVGAFASTFKTVFGSVFSGLVGMSPLTDELKKAQDEFREIKEEIQKEVEGNRKKKEKIQNEEKKKKEALTPKAPGLSIGTGMFGIAAFGAKFQQVALGEKEGVAKTNTLLGESVDIQKRQLEAIKAAGAKPAILTK